jgi:hypothetical protein
MKLDAPFSPPTTKQRDKFYGLPLPGEPPPPPGEDLPLRIVLDRIEVDGRRWSWTRFRRVPSGRKAEAFRLLRRIGYRDAQVGAVEVPGERLEDFVTDLTSVPDLLTWLVPRSGEHLPAALVHDGLCHGPREPKTYVVVGHPDRAVDRVTADRIFRDAMRDTGTGAIRRWLIWSAVTVATMLKGEQTGWSTGRRWYYRGVAGGTIALIVLLGVLATLDVADRGPAGLPWIPEGGLVWETTGGLCGALVLPWVVGWAWGQFRVAGFVVGPALAVLLPVTIPVALATAFYQVLEALNRRSSTAVRVAGLVVGLAAAAGLVTWVLAWAGA